MKNSIDEVPADIEAIQGVWQCRLFDWSNRGFTSRRSFSQRTSRASRRLALPASSTTALSHEGGPVQPDSEVLAAAARAIGLSYWHLPVPPPGHADADARHMVELVQSLPQPVLAFCRTGTRSAALYQKGKQLA